MSAQRFAAATVWSMFEAVAARHPSREAIVFDGARVTFAERCRRVRAFADGLAALGPRPRRRPRDLAAEPPALVRPQYAAASLGVVVVALNPRYRAHELSYILAQSDAVALLMTDHLGPVNYFEILHDVLPELAEAVPGELQARRVRGCAT